MSFSDDYGDAVMVSDKYAPCHGTLKLLRTVVDQLISHIVAVVVFFTLLLHLPGASMEITNIKRIGASGRVTLTQVVLT